MKTRLLILALDEEDGHGRRSQPLRQARLIDPGSLREIAATGLGAYANAEDAARDLLAEAGPDLGA